MIVLLVLLLSCISCYGDEGIYSLTMPEVTVSQPETYLCTPIKIDHTKSYYITEFIPKAVPGVAHHILIYGCTTPGSSDSHWNCGEMVSKQAGLESAGPCETGSQVVYAWAHHAPKLELPKGVGFKVGGDSPIQYLVLQVHYATADKFKDGSTDSSGVDLRYTDVPQPRSAGVYLLGTNGRIKARSMEQMETACTIKEKNNKKIHPFAFRTHTHKLGRLVQGYKVTGNYFGHKWELIGERNPQLPQMFYPIDKDITVENGDILAARCVMDARNQKEVTYIGPTAADEMCNFYIMYWVDGPDTMDEKYCFSLGPPIYYWSYFPTVLTNIPRLPKI